MPDRNSSSIIVTAFEPGASGVGSSAIILTAFEPEASGIVSSVALLIVFEPAVPVETGLIGQIQRDRPGLIGSQARARKLG